MEIIDKDKDKDIFGINKKDLEMYYIIKKKSMLEISRIYRCDSVTIKNRLKKYKIPIRLRIMFSKEDLEKYYVDEKKTMVEISEIYGCCVDTIRIKLRKYKISIRPKGAFLIDNDGESLSLKYKRGEISNNEYQNKLAEIKGYKNRNEYQNEMNHKNGKSLPMSENKKCAKYLGVHICENKEFLSKIINIIKSMPENNPGYDIVCVRDKKVDVKCSCLTVNNQWIFAINKNKIADYFLMISFDDREDLNIIHIWLVKGTAIIEKTNHNNSKRFVVNEKDIVHISKGNRSLKRWIKHEITDNYKLKEVQKVCDNFKNDDKCKINND